MYERERSFQTWPVEPTTTVLKQKFDPSLGCDRVDDVGTRLWLPGGHFRAMCMAD